MQLQDPRKQKNFLKTYENLNRKMEEEQASKRALGLGLPYIDLTTFPIDLNAVAVITKEQAEESKSIVFYKDGNDLRIGTVDPANEALKKELNELAKKKYRSSLYYISQSSFEQIINMYAHVVLKKEKVSDILEVDPLKDYTKVLAELSRPNVISMSATDILGMILGAGMVYKASDIHLEPEKEFIKVRFRLDGVLHDVLHLPMQLHKSLISRIKILSKVKLNVENIPQDGRFSYSVSGNLIDVRVSVLPSAYGEGIVMRLLGQAVLLKLDDLGFVGKAYDQIKNELQKPNGMILTTGPTGSGKTTTLYAFLNQLNEPGLKIITLEDPVEYKLEGINQTPISTGLNFATGLRSILRQDPDIIMVGEIRDQETADVALQASLTGHVVLSTLHTNDAAGAVPRLINMGIKPFVIAPALNAIIAQRLVRRLCPHCKKEAKVDPFLLKKVKEILDQIPKKADIKIPKTLTFYHSEGCNKCNDTGYKGRIGIYEVIVKSDKFEKLILAGAATADIKKTMIDEGMVTMMQDGLLKALQGITDVEEVFRVTQE